MEKKSWGDKIFKEGREGREGGKLGQGVGALKRGCTTPSQIMIFYHLIK